jgi:CelD/BcsL family acetyltransferase involved in cellulose biosynthesis
MSISTTVLDGAEAIRTLEREWQALVREDATSMCGLDGTNGPIWFGALQSAFAPAREARVIVARHKGDVVGMLPLVSDGTGSGCRRLRTATELYSGRCGLLLREPDPSVLQAMLRAVSHAYGQWSSLGTMIVDRSLTAVLFDRALPELGITAVHLEGWQSPWFPLSGDAHEFNCGVSKGLRQTIRTGQNRLKSQGRLTFLDIEGDQMAGPAVDAILAIERRSWKHDAGTAITCHPEQEAFYRALFPRALRAGMLYGQLLQLDGDSIAYNFGLVHQGVYSCLKHSQTLDQTAASPSQVITAHLIDALRARGVTRFDYMGKVEPHKMRWSPETATYGRHPVRIFSSSLCGRAGLAMHRLKDRLRLLRRLAPEPSVDIGAGD